MIFHSYHAHISNISRIYHFGKQFILKRNSDISNKQLVNTNEKRQEYSNLRLNVKEVTYTNVEYLKIPSKSQILTKINDLFQ